MTLIRTKFKGPSRFCYYYLITNLLTGRRYVGYRLAKGKYPLEDTKYFGDNSAPLLEDIEKYGKENFTKVILRHERFVDKVTSSLHESMFMHMYNTLRPNGYNGYDPGQSPGFNMSGCKQSEETKKRMSTSHKKRLEDPEERAKLRARTKESQNRPEVKAKQSAHTKKRYEDPVERERQRSMAKEALNRPEVKAKMSASQKIAQNRPEVKAKMSASLKVVWSNPTHREKLSKSAIKAWAERKERQRALGII